MTPSFRVGSNSKKNTETTKYLVKIVHIPAYQASGTVQLQVCIRGANERIPNFPVAHASAFYDG